MCDAAHDTGVTCISAHPPKPASDPRHPWRLTHPIVARADREAKPVSVILEHVPVNVHVEGLKHRESGVTVVVHVVGGDDGVVRAPVEEKTRLDAVADVVVRDPHVVAPFRRDDSMIAWRDKGMAGGGRWQPMSSWPTWHLAPHDVVAMGGHMNRFRSSCCCVLRFKPPHQTDETDWNGGAY